MNRYRYYLECIFWPQVEVFPSTQYYKMIQHRPRIIVGDAGFETKISAPEVWCASNKPPHFQCFLFVNLSHSFFSFSVPPPFANSLVTQYADVIINYLELLIGE